MSTPEGWYDDGSGKQRWWDGQQWTENVELPAATPSRASKVAASIAANFAAKPDAEAFEDTVWSAVGQPLSRIGAGRYRVTPEYLFFEKGSLSTKSQQIRVAEIFDVDASQSLAQKARGIGTIKLMARRPTGDEVVLLDDIPNFREGVSIINRVADESRQRLRLAQQTQHVNYTGSPAVAAIPMAAPTQTASAPTSGNDLNLELGKLVAFRDQGILDEEEFVAAKRKLLGL
jgi:hypothetical protein